MAKRKPNKYEHITSKLERFPGDDPVRKELIDTIKLDILRQEATDVPPLDIVHVLDRMDALIRALCEGEKRATAGKQSAGEFGRVYTELREAKARISRWDASIGLLIEVYQALMVESMDSQGIRSMKLANGQPVSWSEEPYSQVQDREVFRIWCIQNGYEKSLMLPSSTVGKIVRDMLSAGESEPPGIKVFSKVKVKMGQGE